MKPEYIPYPSIIPSKEELYQVELCYNYEGFRILLQNKLRETYRISFDPVYLYRAADEGNRLLSLQELRGTPHSYLYEVRSSELLEWFRKENLYERIENPQEVFHWAVISCDDWVDVLSPEPPKIEKF